MRIGHRQKSEVAEPVIIVCGTVGVAPQKRLGKRSMYRTEISAFLGMNLNTTVDSFLRLGTAPGRFPIQVLRLSHIISKARRSSETSRAPTQVATKESPAAPAGVPAPDTPTGTTTPALPETLAEFMSMYTTLAQAGEDGVLRCQGRLCVPDVDRLLERVMAEAHNSRYSMHPGSTKMYHDLKEVYWWNGMKRGVADFVSKCPNCQQVKTDGQAERTIQTLEDMLRACVLDFKGNWDDHLPLIEFAYNNSFHASIQMAPFEALYGRRCRSPIGWFELGEAELIGPDLVHQAMENVKIIQERMKTAQSRQKSYADVRRRELEFQVGDWVFLRVSPMKGIMRFGKRGKLSPRYVGPYRIKVVGDPSTIVPVETIKVNEELSYEEVPVAILDRQVRRLRNKEVASVKVLWRSQQVEEATWEAEKEMKEKYPYLFDQV
ncbi:PREDICTED: uncharacterized protein LOC109224199 [Nicotiana attenuata]|uniref:uncharacterized protein LOC109224199 n=1 Tax=Nicotiana attenuata TaxID=49451 RepID=UPI0009058088|nr:PREDICTED: uncharacterized protein LOC109224199 [Nicotiana attenuata]